jgi:uncharacterized LabA/DUF88 family protein
MSTVQNDWKIDHNKFRIYLKDKYNVENAYYFLGYYSESELNLYKKLESAGFVLVFKKHGKFLSSRKKGNVDIDIVFHIMKNLVENVSFDRVILVSGDGDYFGLVNYLIEKNRFYKILLPNKDTVSSLYKTLGSEYYDYLENIKNVIEHK